MFVGGWVVCVWGAFACFSCICVGFLKTLQFPLTAQSCEKMLSGIFVHLRVRPVNDDLPRVYPTSDLRSAGITPCDPDRCV